MTGLLGQITIASAAASDSSTPGAGRAVSAPANRTSSTGGSACSRTNHSCIARSVGAPSRPRVVMRVATRSSLIGTRRVVSPHAAAISAVISLSAAPARRRSLR